MSKIKDLTGKVFSRLTVIEFAGKSNNRKARWHCVCICGTHLIAVGSSLISGNTSSCRCLHRDKMTTHGQSGSGNTIRSQEYRSWLGMIQRCYNENNPDYLNYGSRGVKVCDRWRLSFEAFLEDMGPKPSSKHSIDRINNNKDYSPDNCRWATKEEQNRNKRTNKLLTYNGRTLCVTEWAELLGISSVTLFARINKLGWSIERALTTSTGD